MLIALCGKQNTGKTTVANYLISNHEFYPVSFADPLKSVVSILFDWDVNILKAESTQTRLLREQLPKRIIGGKEYDARTALQFIGTDLCRNHIDQNVWVDIAKIKIQNLLKQGKNVVVTDCRFVNEIEMLKSFPLALLLCLVRNHNDLMVKENEHISETDFLNCLKDLSLIYNDKSLSDLYVHVNQIIERLQF